VAGGALESVIHGTTGLHFDPHDRASLIDALLEAQRIAWSTETIQCHAARFGTERFVLQMDEVIRDVVGGCD
jgi:hypothetical protein